MTSIAAHFFRHVSEHPDAEVSLQFRAPIPPIRGKVRILDDAGIFELAMPANTGGRTYTLPVVFAGDDVLWFGGAPSVDEQPSIVAPGGFAVGGRSPTA